MCIFKIPVIITTTAHTYVWVEADSQESAIKSAEEGREYDREDAYYQRCKIEI